MNFALVDDWGVLSLDAGDLAEGSLRISNPFVSGADSTTVSAWDGGAGDEDADDLLRSIAIRFL